MFDHLTQIATTQEYLRTESDELSFLCDIDAPPVQVEHLPFGLIEDQI